MQRTAPYLAAKDGCICGLSEGPEIRPTDSNDEEHHFDSHKAILLHSPLASNLLVGTWDCGGTGAPPGINCP